MRMRLRLTRHPARRLVNNQKQKMTSYQSGLKKIRAQLTTTGKIAKQ